MHPRSRSTEDGDLRLDDVLFRLGVRNVMVSTSWDGLDLSGDFRCFIGVEGLDPEGSITSCRWSGSCVRKSWGEHSSSYFLANRCSSVTSSGRTNLGAMKRTVEPEPFVFSEFLEEEEKYY